MSTPAASSGWDWLDTSGDGRPPAPVVALPARPRPAPTLLVTGAAGGAGTSVLSVLAADARAANGQHAVWIDHWATGDAATRITSADQIATPERPAHSVSGAQLLTCEHRPLREVIDAAPLGASVAVDAGVLDDAVAWPAAVSAVLVIAARPDTANRSRTALAALAAAGLLEDTTVVVACLDPWAAHLVGRRLTDALSTRTQRVVLWDYDPHLGAGGPIDPARLSTSTTQVLSRINQPDTTTAWEQS